ncbi:related to multidrug resistant protein [Rhynchosporium secalis]|uniref:Related to multidrug resistant protein n=1 Tax=Rhynchosporium secalis TaxID=38038 RepID=A0A1E1M6I6_RHYSE|nr:related to multidrug resistant protein [Rhynchosporium secalis]
MATSSSTEAESRHDDEGTNGDAEQHKGPILKTNSEPPEIEKEPVASYEHHNADAPTGVPDVRADVKPKRPTVDANRKSSLRGSRGKENRSVNGASRDVEKAKRKTSGAGRDPNIVWWDGPHDPTNPMNFSRWSKILNVTLVSAICFVTPLASSMFAPGVPELMHEFDQSKDVVLASFVVSVYVLGFAVGPLFFAPLSELYGRLPIYHFCNFAFLAFNIACALATDLPMLIVFRFMAGVFGSAPLTNGGGTIADLVNAEGRGKAMSGFVMGPIIGPIIGPVAGGYLSQAKGWRWVFWVLSMISGAFGVASLIVLRETYAATILRKKTMRLRKSTGNNLLRSRLDAGLSPKDLFVRAIIRPAKLLAFSPVVLVSAIYVGVVYGYLYLLFTTFTPVFEEVYDFTTGSVGLAFLGLGIGSVIGVTFFAWSTDRMFKRRKAALEAASGDEGAAAIIPSEPEMRLQMVIPLYALIPVGLFIYGWTTHHKVHWMVPILATVLIGIGNMAVFMGISLYLIEAFSVYAASALSANTVIRSIMGAVLPLAGQTMYERLGLGWGNSLLAFVALALIPVAWGLMKYGARLRKKFEVKNL